jgi:hypothetical protein
MRTKPLGSRLLAEPTQKLDSGERHDALLVTVRIVFPSEAYAATVEAKQALIADGDAMCIAAKIAQHASGLTKGRLGINHPVVLEQHANECCRIIEAALTERLLEKREILAAEDTAENLDRKEERILGMNPARVTWIETACGNDAVVEVGMQAQVLSPGVQDAEEADPGSEVPGVGCDFKHGLGACAEEQIVE